MTLTEYIKMHKGERINMSVGDRFRPLESKDTDIKIGNLVFFYEVMSINPNGYEVMIANDYIEEVEGAMNGSKLERERIKNI